MEGHEMVVEQTDISRKMGEALQEAKEERGERWW